jgi:hypothetical protein
VPTINLNLHPQLEINIGVGIGTTKASNGTFLKSIIGFATSSGRLGSMSCSGFVTQAIRAAKQATKRNSSQHADETRKRDQMRTTQMAASNKRRVTLEELLVSSLA